MHRSRWRWLLPSVIGVVLLGSFFYWSYQQFTIRKQLEIALSNKYYCAFYDLLENVQNVEVLLSKVLVAQAPEQDSKIFTEIWQRANAAQTNLNQLPLPDITMGRTSKFLTQVGDYSYSLLGEVAAGESKNEKDWENLRKLYKQTSALNTELQDMERKIAEGKLYMSELVRQTGWLIRREGPKLANGNFQEMEKHLKNFPTLIYDGPFSDHLEKRTPKGLTGKKISAAQAGDHALQFIDRHPGTNYTVARTRTSEGKIPAYHVEIASPPPQANQRITVAISRQGGRLLWYASARDIGKDKISIAAAREKARKFLVQKGYQNMAPIYYEQGSGLAIFNFAAMQDGIILYPDQIKVTVALDNSQVLGVEATGFLMTHHRRTLPIPRLMPSQARAKLSAHLKNISGGRLVLIPAGMEQEKLTYEFRGQLDNDTFLIYINALNGKEEQVLRLIRNKEGILSF